MSSVQPSSAGPREGGHLPDDLEGLLRAFFRAEMPDPWPTLPAPAAAPRRGPLGRSRLALAASVAFLLIGQLSLCGTLPDAPPFAGREESKEGERPRGAACIALFGKPAHRRKT